MNIISTKLGETEKGEIIQYCLRNKNNVEINILNIGALVQSIRIPLSSGTRNIVLGFDDYNDYLDEKYTSNCPNFGAAIGRVAGRIEKGELFLGEKKYMLPTNHGKHILHGGIEGFNQKLWTREESNNECLSLKYISADGEENFPAELISYCNFTLSEDNTLRIEYIGISEKDTAINLTNHSYFNLSSEKTILSHNLQMDCPSYLETDDELIHTGKEVALTKRLDFSIEKTIKEDMGEHGYDNTYCTGEKNLCMRRFALLSSPNKDLSMEISGNQSQLQVYAGEFIDTDNHCNYSGIAFEPQAQPYLNPNKGIENIIYNSKKSFNNTMDFKFLF